MVFFMMISATAIIRKIYLEIFTPYVQPYFLPLTIFEKLLLILYTKNYP